MIKFKSKTLKLMQNNILPSYKKTLCEHQKDSISHRKEFIAFIAYDLLNEPDDIENLEAFVVLCELIEEMLNDAMSNEKEAIK